MKMIMNNSNIGFWIELEEFEERYGRLVKWYLIIWEELKMTNREQYERMIYLDEEEVEILINALLDAWLEWDSPSDDQAKQLRSKILKHYHGRFEL